MIVLSRAVARSFRNVMRRSVMAASSRGPAPPVLASADSKELTLRAAKDEVGLTLRVATDQAGSGQIAFSSELLARFEGAGNEPVKLEVVNSSTGQARWEERGVPQVAEFQTVDPDKVPALPTAKGRLTTMPTDFLKALDDLSRTAAQQPGRYELHCIQLRCQAGQIIATDGQQLLRHGGLQLPAGKDLLLPALPVFAVKELAGAEPICLGRSDTRFLIRAGSWCFDLKIDETSRFPNIENAIPTGPNPTRLVVGEADALYLIDAVPKLPFVADEDLRPVTLDLGSEALIRSRNAATSAEVRLCDSVVTGPAVRLSVNRQLLVRALRLNFRTMEVHKPNKPIVARDGQRLMVFVPMDSSCVVEPSAGIVRLTTARTGIAPNESPNERKPIMATSQNGTNGHQDQTPSEVFDPIVEAEALKIALQEALNRSSRLIAGLRQFRKQHKAVASAMASLRQFQLTP